MIKLTLKTGLTAWLIFILLASASIALAQNSASVSGIVKSFTTSGAVNLAEVFLKPGNQKTSTDKSGQFKFENLESGDYTITVNHLGCYSYTGKITLTEGEKKFVEIELQPDIQFLEGVEITEQAFQKGPFVKEFITQEKIEKLAARDIGDFLRSEPNVNSIRKGGGNLDPVVRGLKFGQLNVQANTGQKIEGGCPNRMDPAASHIDINDISRIEILKGPYALRYGPNFGAVLNLVTEKAKPFSVFQVHARAIKGWESNWNGNKEHVTVFGGNKTIYFALSGNNQRYGNYTSGNGQEVKSSFRKYNFSAEMGIAPLKNHELRLTYKNSQGRDFNFPTLPMDERSDKTQLYSLAYHYKNHNTMLRTVDAKVYLSDVNHEMDNKWRPFSDTVVAISTINARNSGGRMDFGFESRNSGLHLGLDYEDIRKDGQRVKSLILQPGLPVKTEDLWSNASIKNLGFFAEYTVEQGLFLEWIIAGRIDMNKATSDPLSLKNMMGMEVYRNDTVDSDFTNLSASAGLSYKITSELSVDFALGRGVRNPDMVERYIILLPVGYDNYDYLGNPGLKPENNHQADLTLKYVCDRSGSFRMNGFYSFITNYITGIKLPPSQVMPQSAGVLGVKQFQNIDKANMYGFEFLWISPPRFDWGVNLSAAYTAGINPEATKYLYENGQTVGQEIVKNDPLPEIPPFEANLRLDYKFGRFVPRLHLRWVAEQSRISEAYDEKATPGFFTAGFNVNYRFNEILSMAGGISNIFDEAYYEHLNRRIIGSQAVLYEPGRSFYLNVIFNL
ncbi:MAG: TonB-dependent receptor [Bacteroidales bacterium]|nr:TonB-dependent receptor [Bacteroidales bacterium]